MKKKIKRASYNLLHRLLTKLVRRFWTHCPKCHDYFAGYHQFATNVSCDDGTGQRIHYRIICHRCHKAHKQLEHIKQK